MERRSSRARKPVPPGKFGKFLAVGMAVALIWGTLLMIIGIYLRFKFGSLLSNMLGNIEEAVDLDAAQSEYGQNIAPITTTISDDIQVGSWPHLLAGIVLGIAILTILFSCLGIYGGLNRNKLILYITIVVLLITALVILGLISVTADGDALFHKDAQVELLDKLHSSYTIETTDNTFVVAMNAIMLWFQCCGIVGVRDFQNLTFIEVVPGIESREYTFKVAPACCAREIFNTKSDVVTPFVRVRDCALKGYDMMQQLNSQGCYKKLFESVSGPSTIILVLILIWDILVLVLAVLAIMEIKPEEERVSIARFEPKEEAPGEAPVKKFVPYAKISSFAQADLSRIKSTEIW